MWTQEKVYSAGLASLIEHKDREHAIETAKLNTTIEYLRDELDRIKTTNELLAKSNRELQESTRAHRKALEDFTKIFEYYKAKHNIE